VLFKDAGNDDGRETRLAAGTPSRFGGRSWLFGSVGEVALEFGDGDQASARLRHDGRDHRDDAAVEGGEGEPKRLGCLFTRIERPPKGCLTDSTTSSEQHDLIGKAPFPRLFP
jgi:hypothetical protein